ncbi:ABC transporter ATP-binding protein [Streptomyces graminifolii]|uniref:ABC transporter ATP-binding protein n=1 Tax=Streptomyces graminifolii TaxID=1266771 RepID=UPI0040587A87
MATLSEKVLTEAEQKTGTVTEATGTSAGSGTDTAQPEQRPATSTPLPSTPVLSVRDIRISDQAAGQEIVHGVTFTLTPGRTVGIVGESGSGKTLTCRATLGILPAHFEVTGGSIEIDGQDISGLTSAQWTALRGATISAVFQDPASYLNPSIRVGAQIAEVLRVKKGLKRRAARQGAIDLLRTVHLRDPELVYGQYTYELSGGMLQRVLIAAAIAADPRILIADEATTALDVTVQAEILDLLADLRERTGLALVLVSHDLAVVAQLCDEVLVMRQGEVVEQGPTHEVLHNPRHEYTRLLIAEHEQYGLDKFLAADAAEAADAVDAGKPLDTAEEDA